MPSGRQPIVVHVRLLIRRTFKPSQSSLPSTDVSFGRLLKASEGFSSVLQTDHVAGELAEELRHARLMDLSRVSGFLRSEQSDAPI